jgi:hypothetical protein
MSGSGETDYTASGLLRQLTVWQEQSEMLATMANEAQSSQITGVDAGIFADAVSAYNAAAQEIGNWCSQGATQMQAIATALGVASQRYGATEQQISAASAAALSTTPTTH